MEREPWVGRPQATTIDRGRCASSRRVVRLDRRPTGSPGGSDDEPASKTTRHRSTFHHGSRSRRSRSRSACLHAFIETRTASVWADVPALPGCVAGGAELDEVLANLREAAEGWLLAKHDVETKGWPNA